jgi:HEAT repeat protein
MSYWFKEYCRARLDGSPSRAVAALQEMGTNAVPYLVEQAFDTNEDSNLLQFLKRLPRSWGLPRSLNLAERSAGAEIALQEIRPPAHQLSLLLQRRLKSTNLFEYYQALPMQRQLRSINLFEYHQALLVLGTAGDGAEEVLPELEAALKVPDRGAQAAAIQSLRWIGPKAGAAVPSLMEVMTDPRDSNYFGPPVAYALAKIGSNAAPALPLVRGLFERETNWNAQCALAMDLLLIDPGQTYALAFLTNGFTTHLPASDRGIAALELGEVGPSARATVPGLLNALEGTNVFLIIQIAEALKKMGVGPEIYLPRLKMLLHSNDEMTRANAASRILAVDPADHEAHLVLMEIIKKGSIFRRFAIDNLGGAGPAAAEAIPVLREVMKHDSNRDNKDAARRALKGIESKPAIRN